MRPAFIIFCLFSQCVFSQQLPQGYILQYSQNFNGAESNEDIRVTGMASFSIARGGTNYYLQVSDSAENLSGGHPSSQGVIKNFILGDFIMEFDVMLAPGRTYQESPFVIFSFRDTSNYYYISLSSRYSDPSGGIFLLNRNDNTVILSNSLNSWKLNEDKWSHFRIERDIVARTVKVFCTDMKNPVMTAKDNRLVMGSVGFGSTEGTFYIDNIRIWAPTFIPGE